jgi:hypothetical protein
MKYLLALILALILVGCDDETPQYEQVTQDGLQYKLGDMVLLHEPFYEDCWGFIIDYEPRRESGKPQFYKVATVCGSTGPTGKFVFVPETDLQLRLRPHLATPEGF